MKKSGEGDRSRADISQSFRICPITRGNAALTLAGHQDGQTDGSRLDRRQIAWKRDGKAKDDDTIAKGARHGEIVEATKSFRSLNNRPVKVLPDGVACTRWARQGREINQFFEIRKCPVINDLKTKGFYLLDIGHKPEKKKGGCHV